MPRAALSVAPRALFSLRETPQSYRLGHEFEDEHNHS